MRRLLVSADDFHQEYVPLERVRNAIDAARALSIAVTVQCLVTASSKKSDHYRESLDLFDGDGVECSEIPCSPIGSAARRIAGSEFPPRTDALQQYCSMLSPIVVMPDGAVYLCCGPAFATPALLAGNLRGESLEDILERAEWDPLLNALAVSNGPALVAETLARLGRGDVVAPGYPTSCAACHQLLTSPGVDDQVRGGLEDQRAELFLKRMILEQESVDDLKAMFRL